MQNLNILASAVPEISLGTAKFKMGPMTVPNHTFLKGDLSSVCWDLIWPACVQNLITLALAVLEI